MNQTQISPIQQALETIEALPPEDQQILIELVQQRLAEWRRKDIARNASATLKAFRAGFARSGSIKDLKRDLLADE